MKRILRNRISAIAIVALLLCPLALMCTKKGRDNPLDSAAGQRVSLNKTTMSFSAVQNGSLPSNQNFTITNTGGGTLNWRVSDTAFWLDVSPAGPINSNSATITVSVIRTNLAPNTYSATITASSSNADNSPQTISVSYTVKSETIPPYIVLNKTTMSFSAVQNGSLPSNQNFTITNIGRGTLNWSVSDDTTWLDVSPTGPTNSNSATITVSVNTTNLAANTYNATITVSSSNADNSPQTILVSYTVTSAPIPPHIVLNKTSLSFSAVQNGSLPSNQNFTITNAGGGTLNWRVSDNASWLTMSPTSGNSNSTTITVSVNTTDLTPNTYNATITVSSSNADNSPQLVSVRYDIGPNHNNLCAMLLEVSQGAIDNNHIAVGQVDFSIRMVVNCTTVAIVGHTNGFRVYSPDGATWEPITWDTANIGWSNMYDGLVTLNPFGVTGSGADTIGFGGFRLFKPGVPPGTDTIVFTISITTHTGDIGKTICVDSSFFPLNGKWLWSTGGVGPVIPEWSGERCFIVSSGKAREQSGDDHLRTHLKTLYTPSGAEGRD